MKKGSVTVYLSLVLCVILSLIFTAMDSVRYSCARAMVSLAAEEGLFSLFGEYDRILFEEYGLLMIDGGFGGKDLKAGELLKEAGDYMEKTAIPQDGFAGAFSPDLFRIDLGSRAVTGYVLATDSNYEPLRAQIHELMIRRTGSDILGALFSKYSGAASVLETAQSSGDDKMDRLRNEYEFRKKEAEEKQAEAGEEGDTEPAAQVPENFKNPIDVIYRLRKLGVMGFAVPDISSISDHRIERSAMPSARDLRKGMGLLPESNASVTDRFLLAKFITERFPCFTDSTQSSFKYQAEYAVAGNRTDAGNLRSVLNRLLLIRETLNLAYLMTDQEKQAEALAAAAAISSALLIPEFTELVKGVLLVCWAFGESMLDIRTLLEKGKVPLIKNAASWRLSLENLAYLSADTPADTGSTDGFDYGEYLCILLMLKGSGKLLGAAADLLEFNRREKGGEPGFSLDTCICSMEIRIDGCIGSHEYSLIRSYGYDA